MIYLGIISRFEADPEAWAAHVKGGDIPPARVTHARMVEEYYAELAISGRKLESVRIVAKRWGFKKPEMVRSLIRRLS